MSDEQQTEIVELTTDELAQIGGAMGVGGLGVCFA